MNSSYDNRELSWNYWNASSSSLSLELNNHLPQMIEAENAFRLFQSKLQNLQLDEKEFSLLILMIITRTSKPPKTLFARMENPFDLIEDLNAMNEENKWWSKCQFECVQSFSEYSRGLI